MTRRATAFMLVWAYVACALWLPLGVVRVDWNFHLLLFPPGYFFVLGGFIGLIGVWLSHRWGRLWAILPLLGLAYELGIGIYGGHYAGLPLSAVFVSATLCSYLLAPWLERFHRLLCIGGGLSGMLCAAWIIAWSASNSDPGKPSYSPDGAYAARAVPTSTGQHIIVGPRHGFLGAFGKRAAGRSDGWGFDGDSTTITGFQWTKDNTLLVFTCGSNYLYTAEPSLLLPILPIQVERAIQRKSVEP